MCRSACLITILALLLCYAQSHAQEVKVDPPEANIDLTKGQRMEIELVNIADTMLYFSMDEYRTAANDRFIPKLVQFLKTPNSFYLPLDTLRSKINVIYPEDSSFRIFNWEIRHAQDIIRYYGAIQFNSPELKLIPLIDNSAEEMESPEDSSFTIKNWYGGIIYRIKTVQFPDGHKVYTTFSTNRNGRLSNKKIMDILIFPDSKPARWGLPIINTPDGIKNRFIIEYNKLANVSMNYNNEQNLVYYDELRSEVNNKNLKYTYIPIGDYHGFSWNGKQWNYIDKLVNIVEYSLDEIPVREKSEVGLFESGKGKKPKKR